MKIFPFILITLLYLPIQASTQALSDEEIISQVLREYLSAREEGIESVVFNTKLQKRGDDAESILQFKDEVGFLLSAYPELVIIEDSLIQPDTSLIQLVEKYGLEQSRKDELDLTKIVLPYSIEFLSERKIKRHFKRDISTAWERFYAVRPHSFGIISLSNITYTEDRSHCLFYLGAQRNSLSGFGVFLFINLANGVEIVKEIELWIS